MSDSVGDKRTFYTCATQKGYEPSRGERPRYDDDAEPDLPSIMVGADKIIPRWYVPKGETVQLKWFLKVDTFPSGEMAQVAGVAMNEAAQAWNEVDFGVIVAQTNEKREATFNLVYDPEPPFDEHGEPMNDVLAMAPFPHEDGDVIVFPTGMEYASTLKNTFMHELGHVFGLRHEFANTKELFDPAIQFGDRNKLSVMEYNPVPEIQESDKKDIRRFYELPNRSSLEGVKLSNYKVRVRSTNRE